MMRGTSSHARVSAWAMVRRTPRSGTTSPGVPDCDWRAGGAASARAARDAAAAARAGAAAGARGAEAPAGGVSPGAAAPAAARSTSSRRMRPCGPLPVTSSSATPSSRASLRVVGAASGGPVRGAAGVTAPTSVSWARAGARGVAAGPPPGPAQPAPRGAADPPLALAPSASITASTEPTSSVSPGSPHSRVMTPSAGQGMTTVALSVWISTRSWCSLTRSPSATCQAMISAVAMPSPTSGRRNSMGTGSGLHGCADGVDHALDRGHVQLLEGARRVGRVGGGDATDGRLQRPEGLLLDRRHQLAAEARRERSLVQDDRAPARGDRLAQRIDVERHQAAQVEDADRVALLGGAVGRTLGDDHRGAVGDDDEVRPLAHDARLAQRDGVVLLGHLVLDQPVAAQRLAEEHGIRIADRR